MRKNQRIRLLRSASLAMLGVSLGCTVSGIQQKTRLGGLSNADEQRMKQVNVEQGVLGRNTGPELEPQFRAVFPRRSIPALDYKAYKKLVRDGGIDPSFEQNNPAVKPLNDPSRPMGVSAQLAWERIIDDLCQVTTQTGDDRSNELFVANDALLLGSGESYPTDPIARKVFIAVRRAWRAPLKESAPQIQSLTKNYRAAQAKLGDGGADRALCEAILLAPQFWLGAGGKSEPARRVYQRLANRLPTIAELESYLTGKISLAQIASQIQSKESEAYLSAVWRWHDWQYGFNTTLTGGVYGQEFLGIVSSPNGASGDVYKVHASDFTGWGYLLEPESGFMSHKFRAYGGGCDGGGQTFDPRTAGMVWYFRGQMLARRMMRAVPGYGAGDANGSYNGVSFSPDDFSGFVNKTQCADGDQSICNIYRFTDSKFVQAFGSGTYGSNDSIRAYRITPNGEEQNGRSTIKGWFGGEFSVCNSLERPMLTCGGVHIPVHMNSLMGDVNFVNGLQCGKPDLNAIRSLTTSYTLPRGFDPNGNYDPNQLNDVMIGWPGVRYQAPFTRYLPAGQNDLVYTYAKIIDDLQREPERFVKHLIRNNLDYRELITADWTIGSPNFKLFLATNGMPLVAYPAGFDKYYNSGSRGELTQRLSEAETSSQVIQEKDFAPISANLFIRDGINAIKNKRDVAFDQWNEEDRKKSDYNNFVWWNSKGEFHVRPFSGILTMPAFIQPTVTKARTYSSRIFQRVMCRLPSETSMPGGADRLHVPFVPTVENGGKAHVDPTRGCVSCHITMDPLASALAPSFMTRVGQPIQTDFLGELIPSASHSPGDVPKLYDGWRWGSPHSRGEGYFQGKLIRGFKEMGHAVAESDEFADCAVMTAFKNVYGRDPTIEDLKVIYNVKLLFKNSGYKYNEMIVNLVSNPMFTTQN